MRIRGPRYSLRAFMAFCLLSAASISLYLTRYQFETYNDYYLVSMKQKVNFLGKPLELAVILEEGKTAPTWRQRWLIYRLQRYDRSLRESLCDEADRHRIYFEYLVGDLEEEYGLPPMNRGNIDEYFSVGMIYIPRLEGARDDYIVLGCSCLWEEEHGMEMLVRNGEEAVWSGNDGPWQWKAAWQFAESVQAKVNNLKPDNG